PGTPRPSLRRRARRYPTPSSPTTLVQGGGPARRPGSCRVDPGSEVWASHSVMTRRTLSVITSLPHPWAARRRPPRARPIRAPTGSPLLVGHEVDPSRPLQTTVTATRRGNSTPSRSAGSHHLAARMPSVPTRRVHEVGLFERDEPVMGVRNELVTGVV